MIGKGNYRVAPESGDFWTGSEPAATAEGDTPPLVLNETLPKGITFSAQNNGSNTPDAGKDTNLPTDSIDPSQWSDNVINVTFLPDGTTRDDVQIVFQIMLNRLPVTVFGLPKETQPVSLSVGGSFPEARVRKHRHGALLDPLLEFRINQHRFCL